MKVTLFAALAMFAGTAYAQFGLTEGGQVPVACVETCTRLQDSLLPACGALLNSSDPLDAFPRSGKRQTTQDYTQCVGAICSPGNFGQLTECINCLVANGEASLDVQTAQATVSQISSLCGVLGSSVTGSVTATPTTTGPFTSLQLSATGSASSASAAASSQASASTTPSGAALSAVEFGRSGVVMALLAVGAAVGAALV